MDTFDKTVITIIFISLTIICGINTDQIKKLKYDNFLLQASNTEMLRDIHKLQQDVNLIEAIRLCDKYGVHGVCGVQNGNK